ncbi:MAG: protein translocase subunit secF/protein translocase subunit secD [Parcubacteria group bacterium Greene0416_14]|nr:MAG: protein translocase subunit secF/protein translocase subunit secD [Parcubacteria group bacterium Greene0416_14]
MSSIKIFLDGEPISTPVIRDEIESGTAVISGGFTPVEARELARDLNFGALPVPIELIATQTIDASLGRVALKDGILAGMWGLALVALFLVFWYRLPGFLAAFSLALYAIVMLVLFKLIPVTITAAGIAGFVLSIGMAVDANILIFERMKEERKKGVSLDEAIGAGFDRAWFSIRDANISSTITAIILFWFGTPMVKGFALTLGIGVFVSMLTAISISRTFLFAIRPKGNGKIAHFLFGSGLKN